MMTTNRGGPQVACTTAAPASNLACPSKSNAILVQSIPVFDEVLGRVVYWQVWSQGRGVEKSMYVLDGAGRRITGVQEVRTLPGECLLVLRAQR